MNETSFQEEPTAYMLLYLIPPGLRGPCFGHDGGVWTSLMPSSYEEGLN